MSLDARLRHPRQPNANTTVACFVAAVYSGDASQFVAPDSAIMRQGPWCQQHHGGQVTPRGEPAGDRRPVAGMESWAGGVNPLPQPVRFAVDCCDNVHSWQALAPAGWRALADRSRQDW